MKRCEWSSRLGTALYKNHTFFIKVLSDLSEKLRRAFLRRNALLSVV